MEEDTNSAEHWNDIWIAEEGIKTWRTYPRTCREICAIIGTKQQVLEIGCGVGILAQHLHLCGNFVTGVDISPYAVNTMKFEFGIYGIVHDMRKPTPFKDKEFNWCTAMHFLEHLTPEEADSTVKEIARIGTNAVFCVPNNCLPHEQVKEHHIVFTYDSLDVLLKKYYKKVDYGLINDFFVPVNPKFNPINLQIIIARCSNESDKIVDGDKK